MRPVLVVEARPVSSRVVGPFAGAIEARYQSTLGFRANGRMIARDVNVGDLVHAGDRLAALDQTILRYALVQAKADVNNAKAQLVNANAVEDRKRVLQRKDVAPQADLDAASADQKTSTARLEQAEAALKRAEDQLGYSELRADFAGVVMSWSAEIGQEVSQGAGVVTVARPDVREAVVDIPDSLVGTIRPDETVVVKLQAAEAVTAKGTVREVAPSSDQATRTRRVRFTLDAPPEAFRLGSTISIALDRPSPARIDIPASAVLDDKGETAVWTVAPGAKSVAKRVVRLGMRTAEIASVESGLSAGDQVVVAGIHRLEDGQAVTLMTSFP